MTDVKQYGAVLYTDGSAQPNPGYGGWGIHGYTYEIGSSYIPPATQKKNLLTEVGYKNANQLNDLPTYKKVKTIEGFGTAVPEKTDNNQMELLAVEKAISFSIKQGYKKVHLLTDSQATIGSITHWYSKWDSNGWLNSKGETVKHKQDIQRVYNLKLDLMKISDFSIEYIPGHKGFYGNEIVDKLAKKGSKLRQYGKQYEELAELESTTKPKVNYHDFFTKNYWYFIGGEQYETFRLGEWYGYFIGSFGKGKRVKDVGVHTSDGFMAMVLLKEEEPTIKMVEDIYFKLCRNDYSYVVCGDLNTLLTPASYEEISSGKLELICRNPQQKTLLLSNDKVICTEYNPAHLSFIHMGRYTMLVDVLKSHLGIENTKVLTYTDITNDLIEVKTTKTKSGEKKEYDLNNSLRSTNFIKLDINYSTDKGKTVKTYPIKLTAKVDLPDKVHLAKLIKTHGDTIKISIVSWRYSDNSFGYATLVENNDAIGVWRNLDTSVVIVPLKKGKD